MLFLLKVSVVVMRIKEEIKNCKNLISFDKQMIIHCIAEALNKHFNNDKLTQEEIFLCGLRYSEFLTKNNSAIEYVAAENRRMTYLNKIGITPEYIRITLKEMHGIA